MDSYCGFQMTSTESHRSVWNRLVLSIFTDRKIQIFTLLSISFSQLEMSRNASSQLTCEKGYCGEIGQILQVHNVDDVIFNSRIGHGNRVIMPSS